ncbi:hypothetical protein DBR47_19530 [Paucibacter sp. KBW04]|uniref:type II secretion system protein N n=1 Tax=Paucibacter sp. KBW04 TaxID=2153361 RepID=UPI000F55AA00|nr:type II secretion system protein N [Paucibacter sp. KBW04]RQO55463.1 hypothetical protein DBR47_19530 [Paucibacter sp. KBW04]
MLARMTAFLVWGALACSGGFWAIQLLAKPLLTPAQASAASERGAAGADLTRLFGVPAPQQAEAAPVAESRFKLLGVVAPKNAQSGAHAGEGLALISVDGVPRTVRIGAVLEGELRLIAVDKQTASLGSGGVVSMNLQIAPPAPAATGALSPAQPSATVLGGNPNGQPQPGQMSQPQPLQAEQNGNLPMR